MSLNICCISDTHNFKIPSDMLPEADILIHSGDATARGRDTEYKEFNNWLGTIKNKYSQIIFVPGNHELNLEDNPERMKELVFNATVLINEEHYIQDSNSRMYKVYGSPVTPPFYNWAYMWGDEERELLWESIPDDTDILITHGPPKYIMDEVFDWSADKVESVGCKFLAVRVAELKPKLHVFGHIHEQHGVTETIDLEGSRKTIFVNAAILNDRYVPTYDPILVEIE